MAIKAYSKAKDGNTKLSRNFRVKEFGCKDGSDPVFVDTYLVEVLQQLRDHYDEAVIVVSGYRTPSYNKKCGGATYSQHLYGKAADVKISGVTPEEVARFVETILKDKGGIGIYSTFTHIDTRSTKSRWRG